MKTKDKTPESYQFRGFYINYNDRFWYATRNGQLIYKVESDHELEAIIKRYS